MDTHTQICAGSAREKLDGSFRAAQQIEWIVRSFVRSFVAARLYSTFFLCGERESCTRGGGEGELVLLLQIIKRNHQLYV